MSEPSIFLRVNRASPELCARARRLTVAGLHESMGDVAYTGLMSPRVRRLTVGRAAGPAVTALCRAGDNLMMHRALSLAQAGDVLVIVCQGDGAGAVWGDLATRFAMARGLCGVVVQGNVRDVDSVTELGFPVWATDISALHADKGKLGGVNMPVVCGGVLVRPGDLVVADGDGVVVIARKHAQRVVPAAEAKMQREEEVARKIADGMVLWDLTGSSAAYAKLGAIESDTAFDDDA